MRISSFTLLSLVTVLQLGCERPNPDGVAALDGPVVIVATGAKSSSQLGVHRQGPLDPAGSEATLAITNARFRLSTTATGRTEVELLDLGLADDDLPRSPQVPDGLKLRGQRLYAAAPLAATVEERGPDRLIARLSGSLRYHAGLLLDDGVVYPLGDSQASGELTVQVTRDESGVHLTLDAPPQSECAQIGDLLTFTRCSLFVESDALIN